MELEKFGTAGDIQELLAIRDDIEKLSFKTTGDSSVPRLDLFDHGDYFSLLIEVPGVSQENLEVAVQGSSLTIAGFREPIENAAEILITERHRGHFQRTIELPQAIDEEAIQAHLMEGLLRLRLPKRADNF